jgi:hypothetical protein
MSKEDDKKKKKSALDILKGAVSRKSAAGILANRKKELDRKIKEAGG